MAAGPAQLVAYDALGRQVHTQSLAAGAGEAVVPVQAWAEGPYLLTLVADGRVVARQRVAVVHP